MYLKQLTISGFKSFAKKSELEFSAPVTAIVGPNGSGKSNVAESFRFVLGEQSPSRMRGKKGEDLIWGGTDQVARANRASVALSLNNEKRTFPIDFDEVLLERIVHRDGENEYLINGSRVRLRDVQELLATANIGTTGHHIISQGEADRILLANPRERREMIEDALGLKVYQYKKGEAEKKLEKTRENIERVESLRREVAPHLRFLEKQIKKLERAASVKEELKAAYAEYLRREDLYLAFHHDRLEALRREPVAALAALEDALQRAKAKLEMAAKDEARDRLVSVESELSDARKVHQGLVRNAGQLEGQIAFLEKRIKEAKERGLRRTDVSIAYAKVEAVVEDITRIAEQQASEERVPVLKRTLTDIVHTLKSFLSRASSGQEQSGESDAVELEALRTERENVERERRVAETREKELEAAYEDVRRTIEADMTESRDAEREVFRIVGEQREREAVLATIDNERNAIFRDREEFKRELQEAVALIGRSTTDYTTVALEHEGEAVSKETIVNEVRDAQRERRRALEKLKIRLEELGGSNDDIEKEYRDVKERDDFLERELADLNASVDKLEALIRELTAELDQIFIAGIEKIAYEFNRFFALMFGGGEGKLLRVKPKVKKQKLVDESDELDSEDGEMIADVEEPEGAEGIEIDVKLPNKRVRGLEMLSGGERALTSIALIFAMSQVNPPLFIILDETDAALDEANSRRYGDMIEALAQKSQLILITHNRETMRRAGILYGVTMGGDGVSKLLSVKFEDALAVAK